MNNFKASEILNFQVKRDIISLYKRYLMMVEDLRSEHNSMVDKLKKYIPEENHSVVDQCNYFDDDKFVNLRKRILDSGNESIRNIEEQIKQFDIQFGG